MPRNPDGLVISNWHTLFEDFSTSTQDFYAAVEEAVQERKLPDIEISREFFNEGGIASAQREYLRISRDRIAFDICSAPYGNGHFFSWWLAKIPVRYGLLKFLAAVVILLAMWAFLSAKILRDMFGLWPSVALFVVGLPVLLLVLLHISDEDWLLDIPLIGPLYIIIVNPTTYYRLDTAMMFRESVRKAVGDVINDIRTEKGLRVLSDEELRPDADKEAAAS
jgi:hypothetical protein